MLIRPRPQVSYPPAYLGDFGLSYLTADDENWMSWLGKGTRGYFAPEAEDPDSDLDYVSELVPPDSQANVFQVGVTMLSAMIRPGFEKEYNDLGLVYTQDLEWDDRVEEGLWDGYSQDLIDLVETCVQFDPYDRPTPQTLLATIQTSMPQHAERMDRWGTLSWVKQKSSDIDKSAAADDEANLDDDANIGAATGKKRKAAGPPESAPDAKRIKAQTALERRLAFVAATIKGVQPRPKAHKDDHGIRPHPNNRLFYKNVDDMFNPDSFFDTADPGPIEYFELEDNDEDEDEDEDMDDDENRLDVIMMDDSEDDE